MARELLPYAVLLVLLLLGVYVCYMAFRSRESELKQALRKGEIALQDAERSLRDAARYHDEEIRRLRAQLADADDPGNRGAQFRDAKSAFARLFHPDSATGDTATREIRTEMFKQYWDELERIERNR